MVSHRHWRNVPEIKSSEQVLTKIVSLYQRFLTRDRVYLTMSGDTCDFHERRGKVLLASRRQRSGVLLNILQGVGQISTIKKSVAQDVSNAKVEKPCFIYYEGAPVASLFLSLLKSQFFTIWFGEQLIQQQDNWNGKASGFFMPCYGPSLWTRGME